jgi:itaconate CoA-transferase
VKKGVNPKIDRRDLLGVLAVGAGAAAAIPFRRAPCSTRPCRSGALAKPEIDLTGACNSEHMLGHQYSASGGQLGFVREAYASKGGKSIIATRSTAAGGKISRIVPRLEGPVATPRIDTHYVVTEFGPANLKGLSSTERAHALIGLEHPQFRDGLTAAAKKLNLI